MSTLLRGSHSKGLRTRAAARGTEARSEPREGAQTRVGPQPCPLRLHPTDQPDWDPWRPREATGHAAETGDAACFSFEAAKSGTDLLALLADAVLTCYIHSQHEDAGFTQPTQGEGGCSG